MAKEGMKMNVERRFRMANLVLPRKRNMPVAK